jgi:hypothetical protein
MAKAPQAKMNQQGANSPGPEDLAIPPPGQNPRSGPGYLGPPIREGVGDTPFGPQREIPIGRRQFGVGNGNVGANQARGLK